MFALIADINADNIFITAIIYALCFLIMYVIKYLTNGIDLFYI